MISKVKLALDMIVKVIVIVLMICMSLTVIWQVCARFILNIPSRWSEELARYMMIWITFLAGAAGLSQGAHIGLDLVTSKLTKSMQGILKVITFCVCIFFGIVLAIYGYRYMLEGHYQKAMSMNFRMSIVYSVIPLSGILLIINSIQEILKEINKVY